jgi:hypothetical protein
MQPLEPRKAIEIPEITSDEDLQRLIAETAAKIRGAA